MLVQLVNFEICHSPLRSWLSTTGTVSVQTYVHIAAAITKTQAFIDMHYTARKQMKVLKNNNCESVDSYLPCMHVALSWI
jgi:hypothetical protein